MADKDDEDTIVEKSFKTIVETFSIWAGVSFVVSGAINALFFWLEFHLNYFVIAQPTDIIMTGFVYVSAVFGLAAILAVPLVIGYLNTSRTRTMSKLIAELEPKKPTPRAPKKRSIDNIFKLAALIGGIASLFSSTFSLFESKGYIERLGNPPEPPKTPSYWETPLTWQSVNGLHLSTASDQYKDCGKAPVLWMGSASVILNCRGRLRLTQNTQGLVLERLSPAEASIVDTRLARDAIAKLSAENDRLAKEIARDGRKPTTKPVPASAAPAPPKASDDPHPL